MSGQRYTIREDPYLECRRGAKGHDWDDIIVMRRVSWGTPEDFRCTRCKGVRHDVVDARGEISWRTYDRPEDWGNYGPWTTGEIRLELMRRERKAAAA